MRLEDIPAERIADVVSRAVAQAVREGGDPEAIVGRALARAQGELGVDGATPPTPAPGTGRVGTPPVAPPAAPNGSSPRQVVTEDDVLAALAAGHAELRLRAGALVTPLARDAAADKGVRLVEGA